MLKRFLGKGSSTANTSSATRPAIAPITNREFTIAIMEGNFTQARKILSTPNDVTAEQLTYALSEAVKNDNAGMVLFFLQHDIDISSSENIKIFQGISSEKQPQIAHLLAHFQHDLAKVKDFTVSNVIYNILYKSVKGIEYIKMLADIKLLLSIAYTGGKETGEFYFNPNEKRYGHTLVTAAVEKKLGWIVSMLCNPSINKHQQVDEADATSELLAQVQARNTSQNALLFQAIMQPFILEGKSLKITTHHAADHAKEETEQLVQPLFAKRSQESAQYTDPETKMTPLTAAVASGNYNLVFTLCELLKEFHVLNQQDGNKSTPLATILKMIDSAAHYVMSCHSKGLSLYNSEIAEFKELARIANTLIRATAKPDMQQVYFDRVQVLETAFNETAPPAASPASSARPN